MSDVNTVRVSAFLDSGVAVRCEPPREFEAYDGTTSLTDWVVEFGDNANLITLHFRDKADLYRLVDEITAKAGPR